MFFNVIRGTQKLPSTPSKPGETLSSFCLGLSALFIVGLFLSGCVVHDHHGHDRGLHKGHHKGKGGHKGKGHHKFH